MFRSVHFRMIGNENTDDILQLRKFLEGININFDTSVHDVESSYGIKEDWKIFSFCWEDQEVEKAITRNAGAHKKYLRKRISVEEVRKRIQESNAEQVAFELGISRSTLFRKLKYAEENGEDTLV